MIFKPMLACDANLRKLMYPLIASCKLDGVRAVVRGGVVYSRSNKPIPNPHVQALFSKFEHYDGELIVGEPNSKTVYRDTVSGVMRHDGEPNVRFFAFDHIEYLSHTYARRHARITTSPCGNVILHASELITGHMELLAYESDALEQGYEGLILRDIGTPYKCGRSTVKEGFLLKLKRFVDDEAVIVGFEERMHNGNEALTNELGRTKRSSHQANKTGRGDLGALVVRNESCMFSIGTGFTDFERATIWNNRDKYLGQLVKYKHFPVGGKDLPRHPVFIGFRDRSDT
jgi:DNA ligase-1